MNTSHITTFIAGNSGIWNLTDIYAVKGDSLSSFNRLEIVQGISEPTNANWTLHGVSSNIRYTSKDEIAALKAIQPGLGRSEAVRAAMIPIKKNEEWWNLAQDERRSIMEEQSAHIREGMQYLPAIARKLYHSKDLGEPFDFVTWFEFDPVHESRFNDLLAFLRNSAEWKYVEREVDLRFRKD